MSKAPLTAAAEIANVLVYGLRNGLSPALREEVLGYLRLEQQQAKNELIVEIEGQDEEPPAGAPDSAARRRYARACRAIWLLDEAIDGEEEALEAALAEIGCPPVID